MAHDIRIVTEAELRGAVALDLTAVDVIERAFVALASGQVVMPPILSMELPAVNGEVDVKTAWIPGFDGFAIKVSPGFFDNPKLGPFEPERADDAVLGQDRAGAGGVPRQRLPDRHPHGGGRRGRRSKYLAPGRWW